MSRVAKVQFTDYRTSVAKALHLIDAATLLPDDRTVLIKPNLVNSSAPPVTTPVAAAEAVVAYCRAHGAADIVIGEGCGQGKTEALFARHGYTDLAATYGIRLVDFDQEETVELHRDDTFQLTSLHVPKMICDAFVVSLPVLKDHSFTITTIAMKNMFGMAPARVYRGSWNKSKLHEPSTHKTVVDLCLYKRPELCVVDATVGLSGMHLSGTERPLGLILAGADPVAIDTVGSQLLGHAPRGIEYLNLAHGRLGRMDHIEVIDG